MQKNIVVLDLNLYKIVQNHSLPVMKKKKIFSIEEIMNNFNRMILLLTELLRMENWLESLLYIKKSYIN